MRNIVTFNKVTLHYAVFIMNKATRNFGQIKSKNCIFSIALLIKNNCLHVIFLTNLRPVDHE